MLNSNVFWSRDYNDTTIYLYYYRSSLVIRTLALHTSKGTHSYSVSRTNGFLATAARRTRPGTRYRKLRPLATGRPRGRWSRASASKSRSTRRTISSRTVSAAPSSTISNVLKRVARPTKNAPLVNDVCLRTITATRCWRYRHQVTPDDLA